jgi:Fe-S cluster assembly ATP-binding protein
LERPLNVDLSGGEKKRSDMLQMAVLAPRFAILDEIDSGLDVDAVRAVAEAVEAMRRPDLGVLVITHYTRILRYLSVDRVHVLMQGAIVATGGRELADRLDAGGYDVLRRELGIAPAPEETDSFLEGL